ncbi:hypothetical protein CR513_01748, partial [Mucuna pruriens]
MSWVDLSMDFVLGLPRLKNGKDSILMTYKVDDACLVTNLFFKEVIRSRDLPRMITSNRDSKLLHHFWRILWSKLGTKLLFSIVCHPQINGQTKVTNKTLSKCLGVMGKINSITSHTPFELVYGFNRLTLLDLLSLRNMNAMCILTLKRRLRNFLRGLIKGKYKKLLKKVIKFWFT